jgi:hypothetical protein
MARADFTEMNLYFYMHRVHDFELISYVKSQKKSRSLNSLVLRLLKRHLREEKEKLVNQLLSHKDELGYLPEIQDSTIINRDLIDLDEVSKSFLKLQSELDLLKGLFPK